MWSLINHTSFREEGKAKVGTSSLNKILKSHNLFWIKTDKQVVATKAQAVQSTHLVRFGEVIGSEQAYGEEEADLKEASAWW